MKDSDEPSLTVVVCTFNRAELLRACLDALVAQTIRDTIQIIVVDDGSTQHIGTVVAEYDVDDFIALDANRGLSYARNSGIARARASIIAFTDDDIVVPPDWCELLLNAWKETPEKTRAIGGVVTVAEVHSFTQRYLRHHNPLAPIESENAPDATFFERVRVYLKSDVPRVQQVRPVYSLVGANMSFTREALSEVGGFDPSIRFGGDEEHVCKNLRQRYGDQSILCYPSIVVAHKFDPRLRDTLRRAYHYGLSNGRTWARDGGVPSLRPVGGLFSVSLIVTAPISILGATLFSLLIPFVMWRRWVGASWRERNPEMMVYPLIALAQELCANVGFFAGWIKDHRPTR
jgi:glycosyltransferase involved in cell wall biosynthesis